MKPTSSFKFVAAITAMLVLQSHQILAQTFIGFEYIATSNQKINGNSNTQSGPAFGVSGGAKFKLFEPLSLLHAVEANLQRVQYNNANNAKAEYTTTIIHLNYVLIWHLSAMSLEFPVGLAAIYGPGQYNKTAKEFGVRSTYHDMGFMAPYIHVRWISVDNDSRIIMASTGLNFFF
jgi:hypothetical protein